MLKDHFGEKIEIMDMVDPDEFPSFSEFQNCRLIQIFQADVEMEMKLR